MINYKIKIFGLIMSIAIGLSFSLMSLLYQPLIYETDVLCSGEENGYFDDTYRVYIGDESYGEVSIVEIREIEAYCIHTKFRKSGHTSITVATPTGEDNVYDIEIGRSTYSIEKRK